MTVNKYRKQENAESMKSINCLATSRTTCIQPIPSPFQPILRLKLSIMGIIVYFSLSKSIDHPPFKYPSFKLSPSSHPSFQYDSTITKIPKAQATNQQILQHHQQPHVPQPQNCSNSQPCPQHCYCWCQLPACCWPLFRCQTIRWLWSRCH